MSKKEDRITNLCLLFAGYFTQVRGRSYDIDEKLSSGEIIAQEHTARICKIKLQTQVSLSLNNTFSVAPYATLKA